MIELQPIDRLAEPVLGRAAGVFGKEGKRVLAARPTPGALDVDVPPASFTSDFNDERPWKRRTLRRRGHGSLGNVINRLHTGGFSRGAEPSDERQVKFAISPGRAIDAAEWELPRVLPKAVDAEVIMSGDGKFSGRAVERDGDCTAPTR